MNTRNNVTHKHTLNTPRCPYLQQHWGKTQQNYRMYDATPEILQFTCSTINNNLSIYLDIGCIGQWLQGLFGIHMHYVWLRIKSELLEGTDGSHNY